ncbi:hypothetical protein [Peribacillus frigoritolerans]
MFNIVDWNGRYETPAGKAFKGDPTGANAPRADCPRKASALRSNQRLKPEGRD